MADVSSVLESRLAAVQTPVRLVFFTQTFGCDTCLIARQVVDQVASQSEHISVVEHNLILDKDEVAAYRVDRAPALAVVGEADLGIRFYGVPSGYELGPLIESIELAASAPPSLSATTLERLEHLDHPVDIKVFVTPT